MSDKTFRKSKKVVLKKVEHNGSVLKNKECQEREDSDIGRKSHVNVEKIHIQNMEKNSSKGSKSINEVRREPPSKEPHVNLEKIHIQSMEKKSSKENKSLNEVRREPPSKEPHVNVEKIHIQNMEKKSSKGSKSINEVRREPPSKEPHVNLEKIHIQNMEKNSSKESKSLNEVRREPPSKEPHVNAEKIHIQNMEKNSSKENKSLNEVRREPPSKEPHVNVEKIHIQNMDKNSSKGNKSINEVRRETPSKEPNVNVEKIHIRNMDKNSSKGNKCINEVSLEVLLKSGNSNFDKNSSKDVEGKKQLKEKLQSREVNNVKLGTKGGDRENDSKNADLNLKGKHDHINSDKVIQNLNSRAMSNSNQNEGKSIAVENMETFAKNKVKLVKKEINDQKENKNHIKTKSNAGSNMLKFFSSKKYKKKSKAATTKVNVSKKNNSPKRKLSRMPSSIRSLSSRSIKISDDRNKRELKEYTPSTPKKPPSNNQVKHDSKEISIKKPSSLTQVKLKSAQATADSLESRSSRTPIAIQQARATFFIQDGPNDVRVHMENSEIHFYSSSNSFIQAISRKSIKSLTLHNDGRSAELLLSDESTKLLCFKNTTDCLGFASSFYSPASSETADLDDLNNNETFARAQKKVKSETTHDRIDPLNDQKKANTRYSTGRNVTDKPPKHNKVTPRSDPSDSAHTEIKTTNSFLSISDAIMSHHSLKKKEKEDSLFLKQEANSTIINFNTSSNQGLQKEVSENKKKQLEEDEIAKVASKSKESATRSLPFREGEKEVEMTGATDLLKIDMISSAGTDESIQSAKLEIKKEASKFTKMLKMGIPIGAVEHKMKMEGMSKDVMKLVIESNIDLAKAQKVCDSNSTKRKTAAPKKNKKEGVSLTPDEESIAMVYRKMLKVSIPREAVLHKMKRDNVSKKIIAALLGLEKEVPTTSTENTKMRCEVPKLTDEEEDIAKKYRKMLKVSVPKEAVRHKMTRTNIDIKIIAAVLGESLPVDDPSFKTPRPKMNKGRSLVGLHWTPLSPKSIKESVWGRKFLNKDGLPEPKQSDINRLEELFHKKKNKRKLNTTTSSETAGAIEKKMAGLLDLTRANNVAISLKAFKEFKHNTLANVLSDLDPDNVIPRDKIQFIRNILPTNGEAALVRSYKGDDGTLSPVEMFFRHLNNVQRIEEKVFVLQTMNNFNESTKGIEQNLRLLSEVCSQVMESEKLAQVLETVLIIGNIMNEGTRTGGAAGFKLDSLLKLTQTKSTDGKVTVLDYIVMTFVAKDQRDALNLALEFPDIKVASRIMISEIISDVVTMRSGLKRCQTEVYNMKKDQHSKKNPKKKSAGMVGDRSTLMAAIKSGRKTGNDDNNSLQDSRRALFASIKAKRVDNETKGMDSMKSLLSEIRDRTSDKIEPPRNAFLASIRELRTDEEKPNKGLDGRKSLLLEIKNRKSASRIDENDESTFENIDFSPGVKRLEDFIKDASSTMGMVEHQRDSTMEQCKVSEIDKV